MNIKDLYDASKVITPIKLSGNSTAATASRTGGVARDVSMNSVGHPPVQNFVPACRPYVKSITSTEIKHVSDKSQIFLEA